MSSYYLTGLTASVSLPGGATQAIQSCTLRCGRELLDVTAFGNSNRVRTPGVGDLSGSIVAFGTRGNSPEALSTAASGPMIITYDSGVTVSFDAVFGGVTITAVSTAVTMISADFACGDATPAVFSWAS